MKVEVNLDDSNVVIPKTGPAKEMLSLHQEGGKTIVRVNSSSVALIQECLRKSQYSLVDKWNSETEAPATVYGSAIHKALEVFYSGDITERKIPSLEQMELMSYGHKVEGEETDLLLRATRAFIDKAEPLKALPEIDKRSTQTGVWLLHNYFKSFIDDPYIAYVDERGPFIERDFTFPLYRDAELEIDYFGRIDLVVQHRQTGELLVTDHKTSSVVGNDFYNRLKPNHQYTGYLLGGKRAFGLKTDSFLVNCLQVKQKPVTSKGTDPHFPRQITTRDEDDYQEFTEAVVDSVRSYLRALESGIWPMGHVNACAQYGGCKYLSVCSAPKSLRENVLKAKFVGSL